MLGIATLESDVKNMLAIKKRINRRVNFKPNLKIENSSIISVLRKEKLEKAIGIFALFVTACF
ncbi:hypothetical protein AYY27_07955 [Photobacterium damselae]|uniref:Uncharacterized protein n=1 Tax=Photobacterium damselae TaxID=38293 RepID=A0ABD6X0V7_PHODM|nr:hypothetical protein AYY27_07955 [Photobacterium damselae]OLQ83033.1 hypothetical protein BEI67_07675 [Photobacterium damselae subsp. piscicida]PSU15965.1 hypothetical protein CTM90_14620 [Photobacterium damselae]PSV74054.1 hypothetical protein CTT35_09090 [Photobacterium damselae]PSW77754.1 hypothetical protein CTT37_09615 [Photobacterium damselae]